jgi:hypothetical protein
MTTGMHKMRPLLTNRPSRLLTVVKAVMKFKSKKGKRDRGYSRDVEEFLKARESDKMPFYKEIEVKGRDEKPGRHIVWVERSGGK